LKDRQCDPQKLRQADFLPKRANPGNKEGHNCKSFKRPKKASFSKTAIERKFFGIARPLSVAVPLGAVCGAAGWPPQTRITQREGQYGKAAGENGCLAAITT